MILRYQLHVPDGINQQVYDALAEQVGKVGINIQVALDERTQVTVTGDFLSIEGDDFERRPT